MTTETWTSLARRAKDNGLGTDKILEGQFTIRVKDTNSKRVANDSKDQLGFLCEVVGGPENGHSFWLNQTISPESDKAMQFFWRFCSWWGITPDDVLGVASSGGGAEEVADLFKGRVSDATLAREPGRGGYADKQKMQRGTPGGNAGPAEALLTPAAATPSTTTEEEPF